MSVTLRCRQTAALVRPLTWAVPWWPLLGAAVLAGLLLLPVLVEKEPVEYAALTPLRLAALALGAGASFAMVDRMAPMTVAPTPRWLRQWLRLGLAVLPAALCWWGLYAAARTAHGPGAVGPGADVAVEAAVCALTGIAAAAVAARHRHTTGDALTGPGAQAVLVVATLFLGPERSLFAVPGDAWAATHRYWSAAVPVLFIVLVWANGDLWWPRGRAQRSRPTPSRRGSPAAPPRPTADTPPK